MIMVFFSWVFRKSYLAFLASVLIIPGAFYWALLPAFYYVPPALPVIIWLGAWQLQQNRNLLALGFYLVFLLLAGFVLFQALSLGDSTLLPQ